MMTTPNNDISKLLIEIESLIELDEAYSSSITLLTCQVETSGKIYGRFKDSWNNRVFDYAIDDGKLSYKPSIELNLKTDSDGASRLDSFSAGYLSAYPHFDAAKKRNKKPKCGSTNYNCGFSCILLTKHCRTDPGLVSRDRINKLQEMAKKIAFEGVKFKGVGGGLVKPSDLVRLSYQLQKQRIEGTKSISNFADKAFQPASSQNAIDNSERENAIKDFLTPKKIINGQLVGTVKKEGVVSFYTGITNESIKVRPQSVEITHRDTVSNSDIEKVKKSIAELGFNLALPLICLTNEEDKYSAVTGSAIYKAFSRAKMQDNLWTTVLPMSKTNTSTLANDYVQQSILNTPSDLSNKLSTSREEAIKQLNFDPKDSRGVVSFYKKEAPQASLVVLSQVINSSQVKKQKYSDKEEAEINTAAKSMKELGTNLSAPLVCLTGDEDKYQILSGHLLLEAARRANITRLRVMVLSTTPEYAKHFVKDFEIQNKISRKISE